ncbi:thioredoxin-disulfide reductase [Peptoniphilus raoultii]|uniref:thioredoxin-disulfide reductase n=1 Tax=Peptoniphilus raoultii TaxID=1776387 RepID=UPI0008D9736F|nr:thioredoxin-disulfide reductase [Peptoniphilus raoultii]
MYDIIILGAGPAGLSAGIYAARSKKKVLIIEKAAPGGQMAETISIENYPGFDKISGAELAIKMQDQAKSFGAEFVTDEVQCLEIEGKIKKIKGKFGEYEGKSLIIAEGSTPRPLGAKGEEEYKGKGISFCATCDAAFYDGLEVYVIGGGDAAVQEALFIANFASKVHIIHRRDQLRAAEDLQTKAENNEKIDFIWNSQVTEVKGDKIVRSFVLKNLKTGEEKEINPGETFGLFVFIGYLPNTNLYKDILDLDGKGYIITDDEMKTKVEGVFAAGDIRSKTIRQVVTAAGDGAIAAMNAQRYVDAQEGNLYEGLKENK